MATARFCVSSSALDIPVAEPLTLLLKRYRIRTLISIIWVADILAFDEPDIEDEVSRVHMRDLRICAFIKLLLSGSQSRRDLREEHRA